MWGKGISEQKAMRNLKMSIGCQMVFGFGVMILAVMQESMQKDPALASRMIFDINRLFANISPVGLIGGMLFMFGMETQARLSIYNKARNADKGAPSAR